MTSSTDRLYRDLLVAKAWANYWSGAAAKSKRFSNEAERQHAAERAEYWLGQIERLEREIASLD